jgi:iron uptake system component EfeO
VIGLREGVEASLIVGIIAAFLNQQGAHRELRCMWAGVGLAVALCVSVAIGLQILDDELPQTQQEGLETIVAAVAVVMVSFMIVWMRRNARGLSTELRRSAAGALAQGSVWALVGMAFLAVIREGLETAVFLLAAFQASGNATSAGLGAALGVVAAIVIGYAIFKGGLRLNLSRFFMITGVLLVLVAAGLVVSAIHTAHEAGWLNGFQDTALSMSWLVKPGTVGSSLLTGVLGLQPRPTVGETFGWLVYAIPMLAYVLWPRTARIAPKVAVSSLVLLLIAAGCGTARDAGGQKLTVKLVDEGCAPASLNVKSGSTTFDVENGGTSKVTEFEVKNRKGIILGERENVVEGIPASFTLELDSGTYILSCPNGDAEDQGRLVVSGKPVGKTTGTGTDELAAATAGYRDYVVAQSRKLLAQTKLFVAALKAGDVQKAKDLFGPTRMPYESIEPVAESFGDLDPEIDARVNDVSNITTWTGFHRIEKILWQQNTTKGAEPYAEKLLADVKTLDTKVQTLSYQPAQLANGAVELLNEVASSKITGEEDRYSHTDLADFQGNLSGSQKAFELLKPALVARGEGKLATTISTRFAAVQNGLDAYKRQTPLGFALYSSLTPTDRRALAQKLDSLAEPLSTVAAHVTSS